MQSLECVGLFLFVLWSKMNVRDIKNLGLKKMLSYADLTSRNIDISG